MFESLEQRRRGRWIPWLLFGGAGLVTIALVGYWVASGQRRERDDDERWVDELAPEPLPGRGETYLPVAHAPIPTSPPERSPPPRDCPASMVAIPGGAFYLGTTDVRPEEGPVHGVRLSSFCIDRTEVTVQAYSRCVAAHVCSPAATRVTQGAMTAHQVELESFKCDGARGDRQDHPINCVDWAQAAAYCAWADARLPTDAEWVYAAIGSEDRIYPWGNEPVTAKKFNGCGTECAPIVTAIVGRAMDPLYAHEDGWPDTAPVGSFPDDRSAFGVLDMAGNVFEWVADWDGPYSAQPATDPVGPPHGHKRAVRGGSYLDTTPEGPRAQMRGAFPPETQGIAVGFRCARSGASP